MKAKKIGIVLILIGVCLLLMPLGFLHTNWQTYVSTPLYGLQPAGIPHEGDFNWGFLTLLLHYDFYIIPYKYIFAISVILICTGAGFVLLSEQRQFLKTIEESSITEEGLKEKVANIDPQRLDEKLNRLHLGVDPTALMDVEAIKDAVIVGAYHLESGLKDFGRWYELMIKQYGENIEPHLDEIWNKSQKYFKEELINQKRRPEGR